MEVSSAITFGRLLRVILHPRAHGLLHRVGPGNTPAMQAQAREMQGRWTLEATYCHGVVPRGT